MRLDSGFGKKEPFGDLRVTETLCQKPEHVPFPSRQLRDGR
jgi:hypothetical protein